MWHFFTEKFNVNYNLAHIIIWYRISNNYHNLIVLNF